MCDGSGGGEGREEGGTRQGLLPCSLRWVGVMAGVVMVVVVVAGLICSGLQSGPASKHGGCGCVL